METFQGSCTMAMQEISHNEQCQNAHWNIIFLSEIETENNSSPFFFFSLFLFFLLIWSMIYDKACWGSFQDGVIVKQLKPDYIRDYRNYITDYRNVVPFIYGDNLCFFQLS
jgi:hypothetical protein